MSNQNLMQAVLILLSVRRSVLTSSEFNPQRRNKEERTSRFHLDANVLIRHF